MCVAATRTNDDTSGTCEYMLASDNCCAGDADCHNNEECRGVEVLADGSSTAGTCQLRETTTTTSTTKAPVTGGGGGSASTTIAPIIDECTSDDTCNLDSLTSPASKDCAAPICNLETSGNKCGITSANQELPCDINVSKDEGNTCYIGNECSGINCIAAYKAENYLCAGPKEDAFDS